MSSSATPIHSRPLGLSPAVAGSLCCLVSVLGYSAANICMRRLSELGCDSTWAICVKESFSVIAIGPWLAVKSLQGRLSFPSGRPLVFLILIGLATELGGNTSVQWAYGILGLAIVSPANIACLLISVALLGRFFLGEEVSYRSMLAIGLLVLAIIALGHGVSSASPAQRAASPLLSALALALVCIAGIVFAMLSITIRHCITGTTHWSAIVVVITGMGALTLAPLSVYRVGIPQLLATPSEQFLLMITGGVCNLIAFIALIHGLRWATVVHVNLLNAGQVAIAALAGIWIFHESPNDYSVLGVLLTIGGIFLVRAAPHHEAVDQHV